MVPLLVLLVGGWTTHLKNISQNRNLQQVGVKIKNTWNHHLGSIDSVSLEHNSHPESPDQTQVNGRWEQHLKWRGEDKNYAGLSGGNKNEVIISWQSKGTPQGQPPQEIAGPNKALLRETNG